MESHKQSTVKLQYQNSLNDDDLVDMNEIIQCNLENWTIAPENNEMEQEIKLESYNFLGNKINYEDNKYELEYFKAELPSYESESEINTNGVNDGVINLESDDDDVINLLNSSSENANASNVSLRPNLESVLSDHNYSSQELFVASPNKALPESEFESTTEQIDHVNEMQALIATWMNDATSEYKAIILNDLENEIKRIKTTILEIMPSSDAENTETRNEFNPPNTANVSDDNENDSCYIMSEGHSEPLEYINNRGALAEDEHLSEQIDGDAAKTLKDFGLEIAKISSKITNFSKLLSTDTLPRDIETEMIDLSKSGKELINSIKALSQVLNVAVDIESCFDNVALTNEEAVENIGDQVGDKIDDNSENEVTELVGKTLDHINDQMDKTDDGQVDKIVEGGNVAEVVDGQVDKIVDIQADKIVDGGSCNEIVVGRIDETVGVNEIVDSEVNKSVVIQADKSVETSDEIIGGQVEKNLNGNTTENIEENIDNIINGDSIDEADRNINCESNDENENIDVAEDKASKLNDKSRKRWLASDSSDEISSSDESLSESVKVKRRKKRPRSISASDTAPATKNSRKTNVLLDSSDDDDRSGKSVSSSTELKNIHNSAEDDLQDVDLSNYVIPSPSDAPAIFSNEDDQNEQRVDSELEEFFGFDGHNFDDDDIRSAFTQEIVEPIIDTTTEIGESISSELIATEGDKSDDPETTYVESQQWDLPEDPIVTTNNGDILGVNLSPKKEIEIENGSENEDGIAKDNDEGKGDEGEDTEYDTDDEIDRLVDFSTIPAKSRSLVNHVSVYKPRPTNKPKPKDVLLDILKDSESQDIESELSSEEEIISEEQYVLQLAKQQCLKDSTDDSDGTDSDSVDNEGQSSIDDISDESNDSKLNRFLKKQVVNEIENDLNSQEKIEEASLKENPVEDDDGDADEVKEELELESSGIFEPEIELHDGEKPADKEQDSDVDETKKQQKAPEEKKKWKLDKIAFSKNLFNDLDDVNEKNSKEVNSDNSDCEVLDISMFKTKKTSGDLDKIINQSQKKRDVTKSSKVADECISLSSDSDLEIDKGTLDDDSEDEKPTKSRPMLRNDQLAGETKQAQKEETDRLKRLEKKTERLTQIVNSQTQKFSQSHDDSDVVLDFDTKRSCAISVHPEIVKNLKEHQVSWH